MVSSPKQSTAAPKVIDLFCGCGGFSLGAARAGFSVVAGVDFDKNAIASHAANFPNSKHLNWDLSEASSADLMAAVGCVPSEIDGVIGGPPCQGFSSIGSGKKSDPRNRLFIRYFQIVGEINPKFFVCENVPGILQSKYDGIRKKALEIVDGNYSILGPIKLKASDYGAPTKRTRAFFIGVRNDLLFRISSDDLKPTPLLPRTVERALFGLPTKIKETWQHETEGWRKVGYKLNDSFDQHLFAKIPDGVGDPDSIFRLLNEKRVSGCLGTIHQPDVVSRFASTLPGKSDKISRAPRLHPQGQCPTLRAGTGSDRGSYQAVRPIHPSEPRVITPREAARLQGFPDWFRFAPSKWHSFRQIGNSVSPILSEFILARLMDRLT